MSNHIPGYQKCTHVAADEILEREKSHCLKDGGTWSDVTHSCTLAEK